MNDFDRAFAAADRAAERVMGALFFVAGLEFRAISIDPVSTEVRAMAGGLYADATTAIFVRQEVMRDPSVKENVKIRVHNEEMRILGVQRDAAMLICGPVGVKVPRL